MRTSSRILVTNVDNYRINLTFFLSGNVAAYWKVILGKNRENDSEGNNEHGSYVTQVIIHESYNRSNYDNDIAVMVLASPLPEESRFINSVCLDAGVSAGFDSTSVCYIAGFGRTQGKGDGELLVVYKL